MITCGNPIKNGGTYLSQHLTANDYYAPDETVSGRWIGKGAELLGIVGHAIGPKDGAFEALRTNRHPTTDEPLTPRSQPNRIAFYDFQCSAPKSVSILAVTFDDERLRRAHDEAVAVAFRELEEWAARRERAGDKAWLDEVRFTGNLVAAAFTHDASRELDAQLHTHLVCANATHDTSDRKWYALQNREMFGAVNLAGRVYQNELASRVQSLGYHIAEDRENGVLRGFEIVGVTAEDRAVQSTRRRQIEAEIAKFAADHGRAPTTAETHVIATSTRARKLTEITTAEVRAMQRGKHSERGARRLAALVSDARSRGPVRSSPSASAAEAVEWAGEHLFERHAVATEKDLIVAALEHSMGRVEVGALRRAVRDKAELVAVGGQRDGTAPTGSQVMTTKANLGREQEMIDLVHVQSGTCTPLAPADHLSPKLAPDQRAALETILNSRDGVVAMRGPAGAGKTTTLTEFDRAVREAGREPVYVTPTNKAKNVLAEEGFQRPLTVAQLLQNLKTGRTSLKGKVLVVDEAGMLSTQQGHALLWQAAKAGARVFLVGDEKQLTAIEAGDFLAILQKHSRLLMPELTEIRRQHDPEYRSAMRDMSVGRVADGLAKLERQGKVKEGKGSYLEAAARSYTERAADGGSAILVAPTWAEIDKLNERVRETLSARGVLRGPEQTFRVVDTLNPTKAEKRRPSTYEPGMVVRTMSAGTGLERDTWYPVESVRDGKIQLRGADPIDLKKNGHKLDVGRRIEIGLRVGDRLLLQGNNRRQHLTNGDVATVTKFFPDQVHVQLSRGGKVVDAIIPTTSYQTFAHGYAVTAEKSQGATVDHAIFAGSAIDARRLYVATSRGRKTVEVHVPERSALVAKIGNAIRARPSALDYANKAPTPFCPATKLVRNISPVPVVPASPDPVQPKPSRAVSPAMARVRQVRRPVACRSFLLPLRHVVALTRRRVAMAAVATRSTFARLPAFIGRNVPGRAAQPAPIIAMQR